MWKAGLDSSVQSFRIDSLHKLKALHWRLLHARPPYRTAIVDQGVKSFELLNGLLNHVLDILVVSDIDLQSNCFTASFRYFADLTFVNWLVYIMYVT